MNSQESKTLTKNERLCGERNISTLIKNGKFIKGESLRLCYYENTDIEHNRIMVSVPKKLFKRAVKRNLLKRRIRESYRKQKPSVSDKNFDFLFIYISKRESSYESIYKDVEKLLKSI